MKSVLLLITLAGLALFVDAAYPVAQSVTLQPVSPTGEPMAGGLVTKTVIWLVDEDVVCCFPMSPGEAVVLAGFDSAGAMTGSSTTDFDPATPFAYLAVGGAETLGILRTGMQPTAAEVKVPQRPGSF